MQLKYNTRANIMTIMTMLYILAIGYTLIFPSITSGITLIVISITWILGLRYFLPTEE